MCYKEVLGPNSNLRLMVLTCSNRRQKLPGFSDLPKLLTSFAPPKTHLDNALSLRSGILGLFLVVAFLCSGCSDSRPKAYAAKGKVVFQDGSPVKVGTIETKSDKYGIQATGAIEKDGSFVLTTYSPGDGAVEGKHQCVIVQFIQVEGAAKFKPSSIGVVNKKHSSYATSGLSFSIEPNNNNNLLIKVDGLDGTKGTSEHKGKPSHPGEFQQDQ
jgi:hypothetical protein